jgi:Uma2 family endonuclease
MALERTKLTTAQFLEWSERPENREHLFELIDGEVVEKVGSFEPSFIAGWILTFLNLYLLRNSIGYATGADGSYVISDDNTFMPDVGYISKVRMREKPRREVPMSPDFAVEVKSPTDSMREMRLKAEKYIAAGTTLVWLVFPESQTIEVYYGKQEVVTLGIADMLTGYDVLPDFSLAVKDIFAQ